MAVNSMVFAALVICTANAVDPASIPSVKLQNAVNGTVLMPATGLGTGAYTSKWWNASEVSEAVFQWLSNGGRRIDTSLSYGDQIPISVGIQRSQVPREDIFITSKVGPFDALGYQDSLDQFDSILATLNTTYVDLLLIHWPGPAGNSTDPACVGDNSSPKLCRQSTWKALEKVFNSGRARAIGVSNFEQNHLQDILDLNSLVPAVNQVEFHPYWHEDDLVAYCKGLNIQFNGYSPLGAPDVSVPRKGWGLLNDTALLRLADALHRDISEVVLAYEYGKGMVVNPRTKNVQHMLYNLGFFDLKLSAEQVATIDAIKAPSGNGKVCGDPHSIP